MQCSGQLIRIAYHSSTKLEYSISVLQWFWWKGKYLYRNWAHTWYARILQSNTFYPHYGQRWITLTSLKGIWRKAVLNSLCLLFWKCPYQQNDAWTEEQIDIGPHFKQIICETCRTISGQLLHNKNTYLLRRADWLQETRYKLKETSVLYIPRFIYTYIHTPVVVSWCFFLSITKTQLYP